MTSIINHPQPPPVAQQECTCQVLPPYHVRPGDGTGVQDPWLTKLYCVWVARSECNFVSGKSTLMEYFRLVVFTLIIIHNSEIVG